LWLYWRQNVVQHYIDKEMYTVSVVFPLFFLTSLLKHNLIWHQNFREHKLIVI
jgi:hypothetical protein